MAVLSPENSQVLGKRITGLEYQTLAPRKAVLTDYELCTVHLRKHKNPRRHLSDSEEDENVNRAACRRYFTDWHARGGRR